MAAFFPTPHIRHRQRALMKHLMVTQMTTQLVLCSQYINRGYRYLSPVFPLTTRDRVQWYVHNSAHEHPALTFLHAVCTLSGTFSRLLLFIYGAEVSSFHRVSLTPLAMPWKRISGHLTRISAGMARNVWGVNSSGHVYRYTGDDKNPWVRVPGTLTEITAASDGTVWGINSAGHIYRYTWGSSPGDPGHWVRIPGTVASIGAGADGRVWGVNSAGAIFRYTGDRDTKDWKRIPGTLHAIAVGVETNVWGVNQANHIFMYSGDDTNPWVRITGGLSHIAAGADGVVWGVNANGSVFRWRRS